MKKRIGNLSSPLFIMGALLMLTNCKKEVTKKDPIITWVNPTDITYGTLLSATQLNATSDVPGTFTYTPAIGSKLNVGANQDLKVDFTPTDATNYNTANKTVKIKVIAPPIIVTDADGNVYQTVTIGTQTWMAENLRTTRYNDGTSIPNVTSASEWENLTMGAYCNYNNTTSTDTIATYGRLYNWYAVNTGKIAPEGWHVPSDAEWSMLTDYLGGESVAGGKLKETGTTHWGGLYNTGATNETGFTALPGGHRDNYGTFYFIGYFGFWWNATKISPTFADHRVMNYVNSSVNSYNYNKEFGFSVRCVRD